MISELFAHPENWTVSPSLRGSVSEADEGELPPVANATAPLKEGGTLPRIITPTDIRELVDMISSSEINGKQAKEIFIKMLDGEVGSPKQIADKFGMKQITDLAAIEKIIDDIINANTAQAEQYRAGKTGLMGFFVGQIMKATGGSANPATVNEILTKKLKG